MTRIDANVSEFPDFEWDENLRLLISAWGIIDEAVAEVPDVVGRPDANGDVTVHLLPTTHESGFYSVELSAVKDGSPVSRFLRIRVPVEGPVRLADLVVSDDEG